MKNLLNKNLILIFAVFALVLGFSLTNTVSARTVTVDFGANTSFDNYPNNNNNTGNNNNNNNNNSGNNNNTQNTSVIPVITSISPSSAITKTGPQTITINGYNFIPSSVARWNGSDRNTTYVGSNQLIMKTIDSDMATIGSFPITVYNHTPNGGVSNAKYFSVNKTPSTSSNTKPKPSSTTKPKPASTTPACVTETAGEEDNSNLTASAIFASDSFLPTSFLGWLLLLILILLIVVVWRKLNRSGEKYKNKPLKQA